MLVACATKSPLNSVSPLPVPTASEINVTEVVEFVQAAPELGLVTSVDFVVMDVEAGSAAAMAHVQVGDQLLALDEIQLRDATAVAAAKTKIVQGQSMRLTVLRAGARIEVSIVPQAPNAYPSKVTPTPAPSNAVYL